jgi:FkbH-like protein
MRLDSTTGTMKLIDALRLIRTAPADGNPYRVALVCGFTPLHLQTFLAAYLTRLCPRERVEILPALFGDLPGNLERLDAASCDAVVVPIEWSDLDARLGIRSLGGWKPEHLENILHSAQLQLDRIQGALAKLEGRIPAALSLPTLPLPPVSFHSIAESGRFELQLRNSLVRFALACSEMRNVKIVNEQNLALHSPIESRFDVRSEIASGFPYHSAHAAELGQLFAKLLRGPIPKKGLITDLDDTVWAGILGDAGAHGVKWDTDSGAHTHGLYQQMLESLAGSGVLLAVASKNDPKFVEEAFERSDMLLQRANIFPFEVHWEQKSQSVVRILKAWNVGPDAVVFVDDSPMEIAEVQAAFPEVTCLLFPREKPEELWRLLINLRQLFGKSFLSDEDSLRLESLRSRAAVTDSASRGEASLDAFLQSASASITFEFSRDNSATRAFELVNKTNQFNLNGERYTPASWNTALNRPGAFLLTVTYRDNFGPLGKIAVVLGAVTGKTIRITSWVLSCRAFSRRIEHRTLQHLFERFKSERIEFDFQATPRNEPLQSFFRSLGVIPESGYVLERDAFLAQCPPLYQTVEDLEPESSLPT